MIDAILSILFSVSILLFFRMLKPTAGLTLQVITVNYLVAFGLGRLSGKWAFDSLWSHPPGWLPIALLLGMMFIGTFFLFALSSRKAGVGLTAVASRISLFIPVAGGFFFFDEHVSVNRIVGLLVVVPAFYYSLYKGAHDGQTIKLRQALLPLALLVGTGLNDLLMNFATRKYAPVDLPMMLSLIFGISFILGFFILIFNILNKNISLRIVSVLLGFVLGAINYASTYFLLRAMQKLDASVLFPFVNASIVMLAALADAVFFGKRPGRHRLIGFTLTVISIVLISI